MNNNISKILFSFNKQPLDIKNNSFDFLRILFVTLVIFFHCVLAGAKDTPMNLISTFNVSDVNGTNINLGTFAVYCFFVISGFLITHSWMRSKNAGDYLIKRIQRIFPAFIVCLLWIIVFFTPILFYIDHNSFDNYYFTFLDSLGYFFQNHLLIINKASILGLDKLIDMKTPVNGSLWTLIHEFRSYIVVAILGSIGFLSRKYLVLFLAIVINIFYFIAVKDGWTSQIYFDINFLALSSYFWFGSVFYLFNDKMVYDWKIFGIVVVIFNLAFFYNLFPLLVPSTLTYIILFLGKSLPLKNLSQKIGDWSYGAYLYSQSIQVMLVYFGIGALGFFPFFGFSIVLSLIAGFVSWHLVEKRFLARYQKPKTIQPPETSPSLQYTNL
jgi:peptidoglycan/LPS O-acetylase OafA/YrhL